MADVRLGRRATQGRGLGMCPKSVHLGLHAEIGGLVLPKYLARLPNAHSPDFQEPT